MQQEAAGGHVCQAPPQSSLPQLAFLSGCASLAFLMVCLPIRQQARAVSGWVGSGIMPLGTTATLISLDYEIPWAAAGGVVGEEKAVY